MTNMQAALTAIRALIQSGADLSAIAQDDQSPSPEALAAAEAMDNAIADGKRILKDAGWIE